MTLVGDGGDVAGEFARTVREKTPATLSQQHSRMIDPGCAYQPRCNFFAEVCSPANIQTIYEPKMPPYDSDSSDEGEEFTETNVLLGYATKDITGDSISHLGGTPVCATLYFHYF